MKIYILNSPDIDIDVGTLQAEAALGAIGGGIGALVTTPMDVLTTLIITSSQGAASSEGVTQYLKDLLEEQGPKGLLQGATQRTLYWAPAIGIFLSVYCSLRKFALISGL